MLEQIPDWTSWAITLISITGGVIAFAKFWFNRGKNTTAYRLERQNCINHIRKKVDDLEKEFTSEKNGSLEEHDTMKQGMIKLKDKVNKIESDVSYIKGVIDQALKHK